MAQQGQLKSRWHSFGGQQWWVLRGEGNSDSAGGQGTPLPLGQKELFGFQLLQRLLVYDAGKGKEY